MNRFLTTAALAGFFAMPALAQDMSQLAASAGLTAAEARTMSLAEIAAAKFNRDSRDDDRQTVASVRTPIAVDPVRHAQLIAAADLDPDAARGMTLAGLTAAKYNASGDGDHHQTPVSMSSRGPVTMVPLQLIYAADLTPQEARGLSLNEIAARAHNLHSSADNQQ